MTKHNDQGGGNRPSSVPSQTSRPAAERTPHRSPGADMDLGGSGCSSDIGMGTTTQASATVGATEPTGQAIIDEAREQARTLASEAKDQTAELAGQAKQQVSTLIADQKHRAADRLGTLAGALRDAGRKLGNDELGTHVGRYAARAANQVESMSSYVRDTELQTFVRDTGQFARRRPEVFIGGAFLAGLLAARFLKSSSGNARQPDLRIGGR